MEIKINIPKNDYVQPTEVRKEVVQAICDAILESKLDCESIHDLTIYESEPKVCVYKAQNGVMRICGLKADEDEGQVNVRNREMDEAFRVIQDAGYFIYGRYNQTYGEHVYHFSRKPYYKNVKATRMYFGVFID